MQAEFRYHDNCIILEYIANNRLRYAVFDKVP